MNEILDSPFPNEYYKKQGWYESLVKHYGITKAKLPVDILESPIGILTDSLYAVVEIYGDFPDIVYKALGQVIDPFFSIEEYKKEIYQVLYDAGVEEGRPSLVMYADSLLAIRKLFQKNEEFYNENFVNEIEQVGYDEFSSVVSDITKIHVNQFRKIIAARKD